MIRFLDEEPAQSLVLNTIDPSHDAPQEDAITDGERNGIGIVRGNIIV
jgi:hypothetical protein